MTEKLYKSKVSYYETDCMNIVHHSNYIRYFEDARIQYMHDIGCDVAEMQSKGLYIPNVDAYARYKKPLKFGCLGTHLHSRWFIFIANTRKRRQRKLRYRHP